MEKDSPLMSGWDDPSVVEERLGPALRSRGIVSQSSGISSIKVSPLGGHSGLSGDMSLLTLSSVDGGEKITTVKLVLKRTRPTEEARLSAKKLGSYREAAFYSIIAPWLEERLGKVPLAKSHGFIPPALFSGSDPVTCQKAIVLDFYENATEAGAFYPHSIHNRQGMRKLPPLPPVNRRSITLEATRMSALLHGAFYRNKSLFNPSMKPHLRMSDWIQGIGRDNFLSAQQGVSSKWENAKSEWEKGQFYDGKVKMEEDFVSVMSASMASALDFDSFVSMWSGTGDVNSSTSAFKGGNVGRKLDWSLVHGDFHPGNVLCLHSKFVVNQHLNWEDGDEDLQPRLVLLDWEAVGVGSGPQDIGQYLISHLETQEACDMLDEITSVYRHTLIETLDATNSSYLSEVPSMTDLKKEIIHGGLERWIWLYSFMCGLSIPPIYMQYFHDQVYRWIVSNNITPDSVGMPRP